MAGPDDQLRDDALRIWRAGVDAVQPARLIPEFIHVDGGAIWIDQTPIPLADIGRIAVVGGGKACAAMAAALERELGPQVLREKQVTGWVNVPDNAAVGVRQVHVHRARPAGVNEPTEIAAAGVQEMLRLVASLGPRDLCFCLLSGGASALMPAPVEGLPLADKVVLTRELSARGANIHQLNAVRRELSVVKGGGLARACRAGRLVALIISDVPGDDVATIGSGPTVATRAAADQAIGVLVQFRLQEIAEGRRAIELLRRTPPRSADAAGCAVTNIVIGNNAAAVDAAGIEAERLGYSHAMECAKEPEGAAEAVAQRLVGAATHMRAIEGPDCLVSGGEPTVELAPPSRRGLGGRNQQLCLAALALVDDWRGMALLSGGTDGEDGPTDAAGAWVDERVAANARRLGLDSREFLARNDAYHFFERAGGLIKTGATHTNVCDLRVVCVRR